jgi:site-specific DNA-cytosine methylase
MNVLSLFDGISCGRLALERAGIPVAAYYASEIDKHAITVSKANWPDIVQLGDVINVRAESLPKIDLLLAGSPCQGFSSNGSQKGLEHKQSRLFWEFIRLLRALKPKHFLLENVSMKQEWRDIISKEVGCEPLRINSSLVSAQSRPRLYWTNIPGVTVPEDKGLTIFDILESPAAPVQPMVTRATKAYCLTATHGNCLGKDGLPIPSEIIHNTKRHQRTCILLPSGREVRTPMDKPNLPTKFIGRSNETRFNSTDRVYATDGKSPCLCTISPPKIGERVISDEPGLPNSGVKLDGMCVIDKEHWRMLTPLECERLQTVPDGYTSSVTQRQRYRCLGNGWTVDVIAHLLSFKL